MFVLDYPQSPSLENPPVAADLNAFCALRADWRDTSNGAPSPLDDDFLNLPTGMQGKAEGTHEHQRHLFAWIDEFRALSGAIEWSRERKK